MKHPDTLESWPDCPVKGCKNKCCLSLKSHLCYPHTMEKMTREMLAGMHNSTEDFEEVFFLNLEDLLA